MTDVKELKQLTIDGFPDYDFRIANYIVDGSGAHSLRTRYWVWLQTKLKSYRPARIIKFPERRSPMFNSVPDNAKLVVDQSCRIPVNLVKTKYEVVNGTNETPDYIVLRSDLNTYNLRSICGHFRVFISDQHKLGLCVYYPSGGTSDLLNSLTIDDYRNIFMSTLTGWDFRDFVPLDGNCHTDYTIGHWITDGLQAFYDKTIPFERFVSEDHLVTGSKKLDADTMYSCIMMMKSLDSEIRKTAAITLANTNYYACIRLIAWFIDYFGSTVRWLNTTSSVKWLLKKCDLWNRPYTKLANSDEIEIAKQLITRFSDGKITFIGNEMHCTDINALTGICNNLRKIIPGIRYDLETANAIANQN